MHDAFGRRKRLSLLSLLLVGIFVSTSFSLCGCESLKKKFIRQKKKDADADNNFVPVLEPEEYPQKVKTPAQSYRYHYSLWRIWHKDLQEAVYMRGSDKKQLYLVDQLAVQMEAMKGFLQGDKQTSLNELIKTLSDIKEELQKPAAMRHYTEITRDLNFIGHGMFNDYKFSAIESSLSQ